MLIWLTLNIGLSMGTWLPIMGSLPLCQVSQDDVAKTPQHFLMLCSKATLMWMVFFKVWVKWEAPMNVSLTCHHSTIVVSNQFL
jgi:hypothetical protein